MPRVVAAVTSLKGKGVKEFCTYAAIASRNPGKFGWKMKPLLPSSPSNTQSSITLVENGCVISNPSEVAEIFNDHFSNIVQADNSLNPQDFTIHPSFNLIADKATLVNFNSVPVSSSYVSTVLHNLDPKKTVGVDGISSRLLRLSAPGIVDEITKLINFFIIS